jgi:type I restriction enzyme S subunit
MRAYPEYKASGVEWLGDIPSDWNIIKLKYIAKIYNGQDQKDVLDENGKYPVYGSGGIFGYANQYLFEAPSVLLGRKGTVDKPILVLTPFWSVDTAYYTKISKKVNPFLFYHLCNQINFDYYIYGSTIPSMAQRDLNEIKFPISSLSEQQSIVNFLDYKTRLIDNFITNRQQQQKLLKEQKAGIINKAVTKGINPHANMKPSGIEWLPEIPVTWDVWKMKFLSRIETGNKNTEDAEENGIYPFYVRSDKVEKISSYSFEGEAILTAGDGVGVAKVYHYANSKMAIHQRVYKISHFKRVLGEFLYFYIKDNFEKEVIKLSAKTTVDSLRMPMLANFPVAHPDKDEQELILEYIKKESEKIDTLITKYQKQIELMQEYRTALISQAVTGKIDVRHWKPKHKAQTA